MSIQVELSRIVISEINTHQVIFLKEKDGSREIPIIIGIFEATCIDRRVKGLQPQRPLTHDLICSVIESLGGKIQDVFVNSMEDQTFYAAVRIVKGNELIEIDARPSDAIAIAVSFDPHLPILVENDVFEKVIQQKT